MLAGEEHSDASEGVCPVLSEFARVLGIAMPDFLRTQLLVPLVPALVDTRDPAPEGVNARHATALEQGRCRGLVLWAINHKLPTKVVRGISSIPRVQANELRAKIGCHSASLRTGSRSHSSGLSTPLPCL